MQPRLNGQPKPLGQAWVRWFRAGLPNKPWRWKAALAASASADIVRTQNET